MPRMKLLLLASIVLSLALLGLVFLSVLEGWSEVLTVLFSLAFIGTANLVVTAWRRLAE